MAKLQLAECRQFFLAVIEKAEAMQVPVSIAVVGPEGHLIALERMDNAGWITPETAWAKAFTMSAFRSMSPRFQDGLVTQHWLRERNPQLAVNAAVFTGGKIFISGGAAPIFKDNEMVGAYGISGGTSDQDEEMGNHARAKLGWQHRPAVDDTTPEVKQHINQIYDKIGLGKAQL
ncbi:heme-binding protein [Belnapia sp. T6]|uniref:Heme-binding protein n=1 Tax=Belnapia mucosa TaxID=2804532 RepID=A0ABS1V8M0_9PROT|nr:heme-binding protein [Belnapia mucosa]MBL6457687.1 heme-binding protein [Belnapia mucosa]